MHDMRIERHKAPPALVAHGRIEQAAMTIGPKQAGQCLAGRIADSFLVLKFLRVGRLGDFGVRPNKVGKQFHIARSVFKNANSRQLTGAVVANFSS